MQPNVLQKQDRMTITHNKDRDKPQGCFDKYIASDGGEGSPCRGEQTRPLMLDCVTMIAFHHYFQR